MTVTSLWVGATSDTGARVVGKVSGSSAELLVSEDSGFSSVERFGPVNVTPEGVATAAATGLARDTRYFYRLEVDGVQDPGDPTGQFRTHPVAVGEPASFTFAAFSCAGSNPDFPGSGNVLAPDRLSNHPVFDTVRGKAPLFLCQMGDLHYYDLGSGLHGISGGGSLANYRRAYDDVLLQPRPHQLYREVGTVYTWDDHDFGPNNSDGTYVDRANSAQVYRERVPHYDLAEPSGPIHQTWQIGRVLFIASDTRYHRSPNGDPDTASKTMLGQAQKDWMDTLLATSAAEMLVWHMPSQWMGDTGDSWGSFATERDELVQMFGDRGWLNRMMIISGDLHALTIDTGTGNQWGNFPVFHFASMDSNFLGADLTRYDMGGVGGQGQYGTVQITDTGTAKVTGTGWQDTTVWKSHTFYSEESVTEAPLLTLDYTAGHISPPFEPIEDDANLRNDVTVDREGGSSARVVQESGALSVQDPPDGVGRYDAQSTLNIASDDDLVDQAGWRVHRGTVDEPRYPKVTVNLARNMDLMPDVAAVESGDLFTIANPPAWLPPGDIELFTEGYEERLSPTNWEWAANTSPATPWDVAVTNSRILGRLDTAGSELAQSISETATGFAVDSLGNADWITDAARPGEFPFRVEVGGEVMEVTGVDGPDAGSDTQIFSVTRSVNGVVKSHAAGASIKLAQPAVIAL